MSGRSRRGPTKKKTVKKDKSPPLELVKNAGDGDAKEPPKKPKVRPLPLDKEAEWLVAQAEAATLAQKQIINSLEGQLLERDEMILGLRKEIVSLRGVALHEEEAETHSKNKAIIASLDLEEGECVLNIGGKLSIGPLSMVEGEKKSG